MQQASMSNGDTSRTYPTRPYLAVSAAIFRNGRVLIVRRARPPAHGLYTLPGGGVELGETLEEAVIREVREETALDVTPIVLAGYRQAIARDATGRVERHFVILPFAARWIAGDISLNEELSEAQWLHPEEIAGLKTTEGLAQIVTTARERIAGSS
jgi:ADP-ribose pyrophosphatase YjhB (NUDIX family)